MKWWLSLSRSVEKQSAACLPYRPRARTIPARSEASLKDWSWLAFQRPPLLCLQDQAHRSWKEPFFTSVAPRQKVREDNSLCLEWKGNPFSNLFCSQDSIPSSCRRRARRRWGDWADDCLDSKSANRRVLISGVMQEKRRGLHVEESRYGSHSWCVCFSASFHLISALIESFTSAYFNVIKYAVYIQLKVRVKC